MALSTKLGPSAVRGQSCWAVASAVLFRSKTSSSEAAGGSLRRSCSPSRGSITVEASALQDLNRSTPLCEGLFLAGEAQR